MAGRQIGEITSDGNNDPAHSDYAQNIVNIRNWTLSLPKTLFRLLAPVSPMQSAQHRL